MTETIAETEIETVTGSETEIEATDEMVKEMGNEIEIANDDGVGHRTAEQEETTTAMHTQTVVTTGTVNGRIVTLVADGTTTEVVVIGAVIDGHRAETTLVLGDHPVISSMTVEVAAADRIGTSSVA